jgi:PEP-CTERM motif
LAQHGGLITLMKHSAVVVALIFLGFVFPTGAEAWTITVTGTIYSGVNEPFALDGNGIFGVPGSPLVGSRYIETITTDPLQSTQLTSSLSFIERNGGPILGGSGAPYFISTTVNGFTYTQTELDPFINRSYLISGIASGLGSQDQVYQEIGSPGCASSYGLCTSSYILAYSVNVPFVLSLDFNHPIIAFSNKLDAGSNTYFLFRNGPTEQGSIDQNTGFYGTIDFIAVLPDHFIAVNVLEPSTWAMMLIGFVGLGFAFRQSRRKMSFA